MSAAPRAGGVSAAAASLRVLEVPAPERGPNEKKDLADAITHTFKQIVRQLTEGNVRIGALTHCIIRKEITA